MKKNYSSPTIFNKTDMKLSSTARGNNSPEITNPLEGAGILPSILSVFPSIASGSMRVVVGRKDIGAKAASLTKKKF